MIVNFEFLSEFPPQCYNLCCSVLLYTWWCLTVLIVQFQVCFSPNLYSCNWLAYGGQAGLLRVQNIFDIYSESWKNFIIRNLPMPTASQKNKRWTRTQEVSSDMADMTGQWSSPDGYKPWKWREQRKFWNGHFLMEFPARKLSGKILGTIQNRTHL